MFKYLFVKGNDLEPKSPGLQVDDRALAKVESQSGGNGKLLF